MWFLKQAEHLEGLSINNLGSPYLLVHFNRLQGKVFYSHLVSELDAKKF